MTGYHVSTCRLLYRYILSIIGIIIGLSAAGCFGGVYHNYHAAVWGLVSGVFALLAFILHVKVRRDSSCSIRPAFFGRLKKIGIFGVVLGVAAFIGYLIKGILVHETGVKVNGWFIVTIWGFMVWKWGFLLFWFARGYLLGLNEEIGTLLAVNADEYS